MYNQIYLKPIKYYSIFMLQYDLIKIIAFSGFNLKCWGERKCNLLLMSIMSNILDFDFLTSPVL